MEERANPIIFITPDAKQDDLIQLDNGNKALKSSASFRRFDKMVRLFTKVDVYNDDVDDVDDEDNVVIKPISTATGKPMPMKPVNVAPQNQENQIIAIRELIDKLELKPPVDETTVSPIIADMNPEAQMTKFWDLVKKLEWQYMSDKRINEKIISTIFASFTDAEHNLFREKYETLYKELYFILITDEIFARCEDKAAVVSHIIAMGSDTYFSILKCPDLCYWIIEAEEYQSLNDMVPDDMRV